VSQFETDRSEDTFTDPVVPANERRSEKGDLMDSTHAIPEACDHNRVRLRGCLFCGFFASSSAKIESKECHHGPEGLSRNLNPRRWGHSSRNLYTHSMFSFSPANQPRTTLQRCSPPPSTWRNPYCISPNISITAVTILGNKKWDRKE
jgi:hypothetical protein